MANWNTTPAGNLDAGTIYGLTGTQLQQGVLPLVSTSGSFTAAPNTRYAISGFSTTVTLPAGQPVGTRIILCPTSAAITVQAPALNYFGYIGVSSTLGGTIVAQSQACGVELVVVVNAGQIQWEIVNFTGSWLISRSPTPYIIDQLGNQTQSIVKAGIQKDQSSPVTISALNSKLYDNSGLQSVDFLNRKLYSADGVTNMVDFSTNGIAYIPYPQVWRWGDAVNFVQLNSYNNLGITFAGTVRPRKLLWIPLGAMTRTPGSTLVNNVNDTLNFTAGQSCNFSFHVPWDADQSVALKVYVIYAPSTAAVGTIGWALTFNINFPGGTLLTAANTTLSVADNTPGIQDLVTRSSPMQIAANTFSRDTNIQCLMTRQAGGTFAGTCRVLGFEIEYTVLSIGN